MDANHQEMMAVTLFRDVGPRAGGFTIYPNSAKILYPTSEEAKHWVATADSEAAMEHILRTVRPVEFCGKQGDVIFTHGWTAHSAGLHESDQVRCAIIQVSAAGSFLCALFRSLKERSCCRTSTRCASAARCAGPSRARARARVRSAGRATSTA